MTVGRRGEGVRGVPGPLGGTGWRPTLMLSTVRRGGPALLGRLVRLTLCPWGPRAVGQGRLVVVSAVDAGQGNAAQRVGGGGRCWVVGGRSLVAQGYGAFVLVSALSDRRRSLVK